MLRRNISWTILILMTALSAAACESSSDDVRADDGDDDGGGTDTASSTDTANGTDDPDGTETAASTDTAVCDAQDFPIAMTPGRLMILQDLSLSMALDGKWAAAKGALQSVLADPAFAGIEFGFDIFPDNGDCGVAKPVVTDCAPGSAAAISTKLDTISPNGATPIYCGMKKLTEPAYAPGCTGDGADRYLVVVSDGMPVCAKECAGMSGTPVTANDLATITGNLLSLGIQTFVIGFAYGENDDPVYIEAIAEHGGTAFVEPIEAADQTQLEEALAMVAGAVVSCTYELDPSDAADPDKVNIYFVDGGGAETVVPYDPGCADGSGWDWTDDTHAQITFCDEACAALTGGDVDHVSAKFGCPTVQIE